MIKDPFTIPVKIEVKETDVVMFKVLESLKQKLKIPTDHFIPLLATSASKKNEILGAKIDDICHVCGLPIWLSPSSRKVMQSPSNPISPICLDCVDSEYKKLVEMGELLGDKNLEAPTHTTEGDK